LLMAGWSGNRITVGARFSTPIQTGSGAHLALYNGRQVFFPEVKQLAHGIDHPHPSNTEVKERLELYLYLPFVPSWPVVERTLPHNFYCYKKNVSCSYP
jgi:hypothetical protein